MEHSNSVPLLLQKEQRYLPSSSCLNAGFKGEKHACLNIWTKAASYRTKNYIWILFILCLITGSIVMELVVTINNYINWYDYIGEGVWVITTFVTWSILHYNLNYKKVDILSCQDGYDRQQYYIFTITLIMIVTAIRFITFAPFMCPSSNELSHILGSIGSMAVNIITMYTLDFIMFHLSLLHIEKFNNLKNKIIYENSITVDIIKNDLNQINKGIKRMKNNWEIVVSLSCFSHIIFMTVSGIVWLTEPAIDSDLSRDHLWVYCYNDTWSSLFIVIIRGIARIFGLLYGIIKLNSESRKLAKVINSNCNWSDDQQAKINRIVTSLIEFPIGFKVLRIKIQWKHFWAIIVAAITASIGSLIKKKIQQ